MNYQSIDTIIVKATNRQQLRVVYEFVPPDPAGENYCLLDTAEFESITHPIKSIRASFDHIYKKREK